MELSSEELSLLSWLQKQPDPVTREQLMTAPCYDSRRCESLRQRGYLWCPDPGYLDTAARTYALTDRGRAAVEARRREKREKCSERIRYAITTAIAAAAVMTTIWSMLN